MTAALALPESDQTEIRTQTAPWPLRVAELEIVDATTHQEAADMLRAIAELRSRIAEKCDPVIKAAHQAHRAALAQKKDFEADLVEAESALRQKMSAFRLEEERRAREEAAREAAAARAAQEKADAEARELEESGEQELAEVVRMDAEVASAPAPVAAPAKAEGVTYASRWSAEVVDMAALVQAVADGKVPMAVLRVDQKVINQQARSLKQELRWPGVRVREERSVVRR